MNSLTWRAKPNTERPAMLSEEMTAIAPLPNKIKTVDVNLLYRPKCNLIGPNPVKYRDLRDFIAQLERAGELKRVTPPVSTDLEMTEISDRVLRAGGPALLFEQVNHNGTASTMPVLTNLFD